MNNALSPRIIIMLTLAPLLWAGNAIVGRLLVGSVAPLALNSIRWALAMVILLPMGWRVWRRPQDIARRWAHLSVLGLLGVGCYNALQYLALQTSTPINITLIAASLPLWMLGVGAVFYRVEPTKRQWVGAILSLAGVALVLSRGQPSTLLTLSLVAGDLFMLLATTLWAAYSWMLARPPTSMRGPERPDWGWAEFLLIQIAFGLLWASAAAGVEASLNPTDIRWSPWVGAALLYIAIGPSILAYWFWGVGVSTAGPSIAAIFGNLTPVFTALMSTALLGEAPSWYHCGAFVLIAAGIVVTSRAREVSTESNRAHRSPPPGMPAPYRGKASQPPSNH